MIQIQNNEICSGCTACASICPQNCIQMKADIQGFLYPEVHKEHCTDCHLCEKVCPLLNQNALDTKQENTMNRTRAYAAFANTEMKREDSASGAIFPVLARQIIEDGGIVYGVAYVEENGSLLVRHKKAETYEEVKSFLNAKYVQSNMQSVFSEIEGQLKAKRVVLFTGTPCQVSGLKSYLSNKRINTDTLFCIDNICHGVPSPKAWKSYVEYCMKIDGKKELPSMNMRDKTTGWSHYMASVLRTYKDGTTVREKASNNSYMRAFMSGLSLRPSCNACAYKGYERVSDITLGDFWGIWKYHKECDDNQGTSAVLIHSEKGMKLWEKIKEQNMLVCSLEVPVEEISEMNRNLLVTADMHPHRDAFLTEVTGENFEQLVNQYQPEAKLPLYRKCLDTIYTIKLKHYFRKNRKKD